MVKTAKNVHMNIVSDPFGTMQFNNGIDEENFKALDPSTGVNKIMIRQLKKETKIYLANQCFRAEQCSNNKLNNTEAGQVVRKNPGFDPVFMKV